MQASQDTPRSALSTYYYYLQNNCNNNNDEEWFRNLATILNLHLHEDTRQGLKYLIENHGYTLDLLRKATRMSLRRCRYLTSVLTGMDELMPNVLIRDLRGSPVIYTLPDATKEDVTRILRSHKFSKDKLAPVSLEAAENEAKYQNLVKEILIEVEMTPWFFDKKTKTISRELFMAVRNRVGVHSWNSKRINQILEEKGWRFDG